MTDRKKLTRENLRLAIEIYHRAAFGEEFDEFKKRSDADFFIDSLRRGSTAQLRYGIPEYSHAKLYVETGRGHLPDTTMEYGLFVDTNDVGFAPEDRKRNAEFKRTIEQAWEDAGLPVIQTEDHTD